MYRGFDRGVELPASNELLVAQYRAARFVVAPKLISLYEARTLLAWTQDVSAKRVNCGMKGVTWDEQSFDESHPAAAFFRRDALVKLVLALTGSERIEQIVCWTSVYRRGEYINPHRDGAGSIQVLVCLHAPASRQNGGELVLNREAFFLAPGDAIAFEATTLEHCTTPLVASTDDPQPGRVVLVGRYFLS